MSIYIFQNVLMIVDKVQTSALGFRFCMLCVVKYKPTNLIKRFVDVVEQNEWTAGKTDIRKTPKQCLLFAACECAGVL